MLAWSADLNSVAGAASAAIFEIYGRLEKKKTTNLGYKIRKRFW
jgi:hypothetical protein